jgi:hypothetical protein
MVYQKLEKTMFTCNACGIVAEGGTWHLALPTGWIYDYGLSRNLSEQEVNHFCSRKCAERELRRQFEDDLLGHLNHKFDTEV